MARILEGLEGEKWVAHLTLTSLPSMTWPGMMRSWSHFIRWAREYSGVKIRYVAVKETGKVAGMKHLHCLIVGAPWIKWAAASAEWERLTGARGVHIRRVNMRDPVEAARYVVKYIGKGFGSKTALGKLLTSSAGFFPRRKPTHRLHITKAIDAALGIAWGFPFKVDRRGVYVVRACPLVIGGIVLPGDRLDPIDPPGISSFQLPLPEE
jgi:hypothetical protein